MYKHTHTHTHKQYEYALAKEPGQPPVQSPVSVLRRVPTTEDMAGKAEVQEMRIAWVSTWI